MSLIDKIKANINWLLNYDTRSSIRSHSAVWGKIILWSGRATVDKKFFSRDIPTLTYSSFMSMIPIAAIIFALARGFGLDDKLLSLISEKFQPVVADHLVTFVDNYLVKTKNSPIVAVALGLMFYSLYSLMSMIETSFNGIWDVKVRSLKQTLLNYLLIFLGIVMAIAVSISINFPLEKIGLTSTWFITEMASALRFAISVVVTAAVISMMYKFVPNTYVDCRYVIIPSLIVSILLNALQFIYIYGQVFLSSYNVIYGSLAIVPLFLLWVYWSWTFVIYGMVLCYYHQNLNHFDCNIDYASLTHDEVIDSSVMVMAEICHNFGVGNPYSPKELSERTGLPQQVVNGVVRDLLEAGLVNEIKSNQSGSDDKVQHFAPAMDTSEITYGRFVAQLNGGVKRSDALLMPAEAEAWKIITQYRREYLNNCDNVCIKDFANE